jgi:hypothetical protein
LTLRKANARKYIKFGASYLNEFAASCSEYFLSNDQINLVTAKPLIGFGYEITITARFLKSFTALVAG